MKTCALAVHVCKNTKSIEFYRLLQKQSLRRLTAAYDAVAPGDPVLWKTYYADDAMTLQEFHLRSRMLPGRPDLIFPVAVN
jgi:hypothetical protein